MRWFTTVAPIGLLALGGCGMQTPALDVDATQLKIAHIVQRVKCDLRRVVAEKSRVNGLEWFGTWSAKVHLTLTVDDTGSLNPGVSLTTPLRNAYGVIQGPSSMPLTATAAATPGIGAISQAFNMGLGGSYSSQAVRQEDLEFFVYFPELEKEFATKDPDAFGFCAFGDGIRLESDLGLSQWLDAALSPAAGSKQKRLLSIGDHPAFGPAGTSAIPPKVLEEIARRGDAMQPARSSALDAIVAQRKKIEAQRELLMLNAPKAIQGLDAGGGSPEIMAFKNTVAALDAQIKALDAKIEKQKDINQSAFLGQKVGVYKDVAGKIDADVRANNVLCLASTATLTARTMVDADLAKDLVNQISKEDDAAKRKDMLVQLQSYVTDALDSAKSALASYKKCSKPVAPQEAQYDPLDLIQHQVNFVVSTNGNITPSWKLARVTSATTPALLNMTRKDTNTLTIVLGRATVAGPSPSMVSQMSATLVGNAVAAATAPR